MTEQADRFNSKKPRMDLLPWDVLLELANHYRVGTEKYGARNWEKGLNWNEGTAASLARHLAAWSNGENIDPENGQHHDLAILWNACSLVAYRLRNIGVDDRPCVKSSTQIGLVEKTCLSLNQTAPASPVSDGGTIVSPGNAHVESDPSQSVTSTGPVLDTMRLVDNT